MRPPEREASAERRVTSGGIVNGSRFGVRPSFAPVVRAAGGDGDGALQSIAAEAGIARTLPFMPRFAEARFAPERSAPSRAARESAERSLARIDRDDRLKQLFVGLRATALSEFEDSRRRHHVDDLLVSPYVTRKVVSTIDASTALEAAAERPWPDRIDAVARVPWLSEGARLFAIRARSIAEETRRSGARG